MKGTGGVGVGRGVEIHDGFPRRMSLAFLTSLPRLFGARFFERAAEDGGSIQPRSIGSEDAGAVLIVIEEASRDLQRDSLLSLAACPVPLPSYRVTVPHRLWFHQRKMRQFFICFLTLLGFIPHFNECRFNPSKL